MLIRSQNGAAIVNFDNCVALDVTLNEGSGIITARSENKICRLGFYENLKRCKEVLDEICNAYISLNKQEGKECRATYGYFGGYVKNGIYQMPEE